MRLARRRGAEERYRTLIEQLPAVIYVDEIDDQSTTVYVSPHVEAMTGFSPEEWRESPAIWRRLLHPDDRERVIQEHLRTNRTHDAFTEEYRMHTRDGRVVWVRDEAALVYDPDGAPRFWQGVMLDVTDRKRAEEQAAFLAYHDKLTGLPNRAMFEEHMNLALARARRNGQGAAVLHVDLDQFTLVNDTLGHAAGDEVLRGMVARLHEATRDTDLVARLGGDEFVVLLADLDDPIPGGDALILSELVAGRIHHALQRPFVLGDIEFTMSASIGISVFPLDATDARTLVKNAGRAVERSKRHGAGGYVVFANDMAGSDGSLSLAMKLRTAVHEKQWMLHYQPIIELAGGHVVGVEALLRWKDADGNVVEPAAFVPLAEEMGLIAEVSDWVLGELVRQCGVWKTEGKKLNVSFNLSPRGLWHPGLHEKLLALVECMDSTSGGVTVDITESALEADPGRAQEILMGLHDHGLTIALDDFGTGYSSLSRLRSLPIEVLKIDRSFIKDVESDQSARSVVRTMIQLAHSLGMVPLGEGIETPGQLDYLRERGCTLGQGFYFSRPVAAEEITAGSLGRPIRGLNGDR
jgi:diguanylate cyclase (GGDEF)-like protein/PAS domain S-box-containing protein